MHLSQSGLIGTVPRQERSGSLSSWPFCGLARWSVSIDGPLLLFQFYELGKVLGTP